LGSNTLPFQSLFTITENDNPPQLRLNTSHSPRPQRIVRLLPRPSAATVQGCEDHASKHSSVSQRRCVSLDERVLNVHKKSKELSGISSSLWLSTEQSPERRNVQVIGPSEPPYEPPERVKTPEGVPSWDGRVLGRTPTTAYSTTHALFHQLRTRGSQILRSIIGASLQSPPGPTRIWRPPVSGHATQRFGDLETHPLANAGRAEPTVPSRRTSEQSYERDMDSYRRTRAQIRVSTQTPRNHGRGTPFTHSVVVEEVKEPSGVRSLRVTSPSQRALQAASGNAIPVTAKRAKAHAKASSASRSISLPQNLLRAHNAVNDAFMDRQSSTPHQSATLRTTELIERFPAPPGCDHFDWASDLLSQRAVDSRSPNLQHDISQADGQHETQDESLSSRTKSLRSANGKQRQDNTIPQSPVDSEHRHDTSGLTSLDGDRPRVRGENATRYRFSGTPIYDADAVSLRSLDEREEQGRIEPTANASRNRVESALSHNTRYFSALSTRQESQDVPSRCATRGQEREQERRAIANGAMRFSS
jgi:hypothetical protein